MIKILIYIVFKYLKIILKEVDFFYDWLKDILDSKGYESYYISFFYV